MGDLEKQWGTSILNQALRIISNPSVNSNWSYSPETLNRVRNCFLVLCDLEIWRMTLKNNRAPLLYYSNLWVSSQSHGWIQTWVTIRKRSIWVKIGNILSRVTLKFDRWPWKWIGHLSYAVSSFVHHFKAIGRFKLELQSGNAQFGSKLMIFLLCDLEIWRMTLKNNRTPLLRNIKLCASFHRHMWNQTGVTVRKRQSGVMTSMTLTFDLLTWPFAWTSHQSLVITPENFRMIQWWEHSEKGVTDGQKGRQTDGRMDGGTDGRTDRSVLRDAWSQIKMQPDKTKCHMKRPITMHVLQDASSS